MPRDSAAGRGRRGWAPPAPGGSSQGVGRMGGACMSDAAMGSGLAGPAPWLPCLCPFPWPVPSGLALGGEGEDDEDALDEEDEFEDEDDLDEDEDEEFDEDEDDD